MQARSAFVPASLALVSFLALGACTGVISGPDANSEDGDGGAGGTGNVVSSSGAGGAAGTGGSAGMGGAGQGAGSGASSTTGTGGNVGCGDGMCGGAESCESCPADCGPCCGDGVCSNGETCTTCASDCGACAMCGGAGPATTSLDAEEQGFLGILNDYRAQKGLAPLMGCTSLHRAAQGHSEDMRDQNYFDHTGKNGSSFSERACDACYDNACPVQTAMGENIAAGNGAADSTFTQWKNSPGHNANMLGSQYTVIGIGRATGGGTYGVYWTTIFGGASEASCN